MSQTRDDFEDACKLEIKPNGTGGRKVVITHEPTGLKVKKLLKGKAFNFVAVNALYNELEIMVKEQRKDEKDE